MRASWAARNWSTDATTRSACTCATWPRTPPICGTYTSERAPPRGAPVAGWTYRTHDAAGDGTLTTNDSGNANTKGKSATFNADPAQSYSVNVHVAAPTNGLAAGTIIACGDLKTNKASGKAKPKHPHPPQAQGPKKK